jgi:hypothetical protein
MGLKLVYIFYLLLHDYLFNDSVGVVYNFSTINLNNYSNMDACILYYYIYLFFLSMNYELCFTIYIYCIQHCLFKHLCNNVSIFSIQNNLNATFIL